MRATLVSAAASGQPDAAQSLTSFDRLTTTQRAELARYLLGERPMPTIPPARATVVRTGTSTTTAAEGDLSWTVTTGTTVMPVRALGVSTSAVTPMATTHNVHSYYDSSFTFAGVTIIKTRVWGDYKTGSGRVLSITDYGCQVVANYEPTAQVSTSKQSSVLSGGKATFKCYVVVSRGAPTPWGQIAWSTKSSYQYMQVNGPGVEARGWM